MDKPDLSPAFQDFFNNELLKAKLSNDNDAQSTQQPFFNCHIEKTSLNFVNSVKREIPVIHPKLNINIIEIYKYTQTNNQEIYLHEWTFMSIKEITERYNSIKKERNDIIDIAFKYHGLGWIIVLSCDLNNSLLFERMDGGSNGFDREENYLQLIKNGSNPYKKLNFSQWVKNISQDIYV